MHQYKTPMPRTAFGVAACALAIGTFALLVVGPASLIAQGDQRVMATLEAAAPLAYSEIRVLPSVDVVAPRGGSSESAQLEVKPADDKLPG